MRMWQIEANKQGSKMVLMKGPVMKFPKSTQGIKFFMVCLAYYQYILFFFFLILHLFFY